LELSQQIENILGALRFGDVFSGVQFRIVFKIRIVFSELGFAELDVGKC
jgi:hypothetical protein